MRCPGCSTNIDFASSTCRGCGVELLALYEKRAWAGKPVPQRRASDRRAGVFGRKLLLLVLTGAAAGAAIFCLRGGAGPLPAGALTVPAQACAFVPPAGWIVESGAAALRLSRGPAVIVVSVWHGSFPAQARQHAAALAAAAFDGMPVKVLAVSELEVGGRPAWRLDIAGERVFLPSANAGRQLSALQAPAPQLESMELRGALILVEGRGRTHALKFYSEKSDFERQGPAFRSFLADFSPL